MAFNKSDGSGRCHDKHHLWEQEGRTQNFFQTGINTQMKFDKKEKVEIIVMSHLVRMKFQVFKFNLFSALHLCKEH